MSRYLAFDKIFRAVEKIKDEDINFKRYLKYFISKSILKSCSNLADLPENSMDLSDKLQELVSFLNKLSTLKDLINQKPKNAIKEANILLGSGQVSDEVYKKLSLYLQECPLIEGGKITELLGIDSEEGLELRKVFLSLVDFKQQDLLSAMRTLFWVFFMTGETQVQDRIIGEFSDEYIKQNPVHSDLIRTVRCLIRTIATDLSSI